MRKTQRKLLRDLRVSWRQYGALVLLLSLGIAIFGGTYGGYRDVGTSEEKSYEELLLADATFRITEAPASVVQEIAGIPGVEAVEGRIDAQTRLHAQRRSGAGIDGRRGVRSRCDRHVRAHVARAPTRDIGRGGHRAERPAATGAGEHEARGKNRGPRSRCRSAAHRPHLT